MFYIILALIFLAAFFFIGKDNMGKVLRYGFYFIITILLLVEIFAFVETERALKGEEITYIAYYDPAQAIIFNATNGTQAGTAQDIRFEDNIYGNITQDVGVPYIDAIVVLDGIDEFDELVIVGNYTGNISVSILSDSGSYNSIGILSDRNRVNNFEVFLPENFNNDGKVTIRFIDNVMYDGFNLSIDYIGVNNFKTTKAYNPEGEDTQFIIAMHQNDYTGIILLTSLLNPAAMLFVTVLAIHYAKGWYDMYQGKQNGKRKDDMH